MPLSSIIVVCAVTSAFLLFGGVLAWADFYSRGRPEQPAGADVQDQCRPAPALVRKAA